MEVWIDWSSSCRDYSDNRKRMQQLVSEPSILGEERRLESRQFDAGITENRRKLELQQWKARSEAHWRRMDVIFDEMMKEIRELINSSQGQTMEATDASCGNRESNEKEREPIGELFSSCNITDHHPLEVESSLESKDYLRVEKSGKESVEIGAQDQGIFILPPARENAQMKELVASLPTSNYCNFASKRLLECDHMPKVKMKTEKVGLGDLITASTQEFGEGRQLVDDAIVFLNSRVTGVVATGSFFCHFAVDTRAGEILDHCKVKGIELEQYVVDIARRLPIARRNASLRELAVTLNAVTNLTRLPVQFPKPNVKMKLVAQLDDELYEGFDDHSNVFFGREEFSNFDARVHSLIWWENGFKVVENQPDQMRGALWFLPGLFENVEEIVKGFDKLFEGVEGVGWFLASSYASSRNYRSLKRLSVRFPRPMVKMKPMKYVGKARPKSWRWVNFALRLTYKCLLIIAFDILVRMLRWIQERSVAHSLEARVPSFLEDKEALGGAVAYLCERKNKRSAVAYLCERKNKRSAAAYLCDSLRTRKIVTITKCRREVTG